MKKKIICIWLLLFCLTGCGMFQLSKLAKEPVQLEEVTVVPDSTIPDVVEPILPLEEADTGTEQEENTDEEAAVADSASNNPPYTDMSTEEQDIPASQNTTEESKTDETVVEQYTNDLTNQYYYSQLNSNLKKLYQEILQIVFLHECDVEVSTKDVKEIDLAFNCCMLDHPEIFYVNGYSYTKYTVGEKIKKIELTPTYLYDSAEVTRRQGLIDQAAQPVLAQIPAGFSDYEKVKAVYDYIILNTTYDLNAVDNQNICSVFLNHVSVCQGYAKTMQYLLQKLGIEAILVEGTIRNSTERHAWNIVCIDGKYYNVDATWGDASYAANESESPGSFPEISYDFLNITTAEISKTHQFSTPVQIPLCDSLDANYYVIQGAYFTEISEDQLQSIFDRAYENNSTYVTLKCSSEEVFQAMLDYLITNQNIFHFIQSTSVSYSQNASTLTWTIGL